MRAVLARHDQLLAEAVGRHNCALAANVHPAADVARKESNSVRRSWSVPGVVLAESGSSGHHALDDADSDADATVISGSRGGDAGERDTARRNEYVLTQGWSGEQERLQLLEATADHVSVAAIRAAGFTRGWRCLDVGAGSGSIARWFAHETGDPALVVATDLDARSLAPLERDGVQVRVHDVVVDDFPAASFDIIHARFVLEHLLAREDVIDRVASWLAPGGVLVLVDAASFSVRESSNPSYRAAMDAWVEVLAMTGTDYEWARAFPLPLQRHGYRDLGATAADPVLQGGSPFARLMSLTLESLRERILGTGMLSSNEIDVAQRLLADPEFWDFGPMWIAAWGRTPT